MNKLSRECGGRLETKHENATLFLTDRPRHGPMLQCTKPLDIPEKIGLDNPFISPALERKVITLNFSLSERTELDAFTSAFFQFVEALSIEDADTVSFASEPTLDGEIKRLTFFDEALALRFQDYWRSRRKWLGLTA